ncbi:MAG: gluconate 2-dehydrogenase subunit 3 family protein [Acidobacteria bacterium]|nr:gluconate 2-dehydrogenase subunit 3 family protein [Acidobacteriota bacterium]
MRRRRFVTALAATPAANALLGQQPGRTDEASKLTTISPDAAALAVPRFFSAAQLGALKNLCQILLPSMNGNPGAAEAGAAEFLDFLIGVSPLERQTLYRKGLDTLEADAKRKYSKPFAELSAAEADPLLKPHLAQWTFDPPKDPMKHFLTAIRADVRTATMNSREWASAASSGSRRRRGGGGVGLYWHPVDPTRAL